MRLHLRPNLRRTFVAPGLFGGSGQSLHDPRDRIAMTKALLVVALEASDR